MSGRVYGAVSLGVVSLAALILVVGVEFAVAADDTTDLIKQLKSGKPAQRVQAANELGRRGAKDKAAIEALAEAIGDKDPTVQRAAIRALRNIDPDPSIARPIAIRALASADPAVAISAVQILAEEGEKVVPRMIDALQDEQARYWAILVLQDLGPKAKGAVPQLVEVARGEAEPEVRREALIAIGEIGPPAASALPALAMLAESDDDPAIVIAATYALGAIGEAARSALPLLREQTETGSDFLQVVSSWSLARVAGGTDPILRQVVPRLVAGLVDKNERGVRIAAAKAIVDLRPDHSILLPELERVMSQATPEMIEDAVAAIASVGAKAVPGLVRMLKHEEVRPLVADALARIGPDAAPAALEMAKLLETSDPAAQRELLFALGAIGPRAEAALPAILEMLDAEDEQVRYSAVYALGKLGPAAKAAVDRLKQNLLSDDKFYRLTSAWALIQIDPEGAGIAKIALPLLIVALKHERPFVRIEAAKALGRLGEKASPAIPALKNATEDPVEEVRSAAQEAIKAIQAGG